MAFGFLARPPAPPQRGISESWLGTNAVGNDSGGKDRGHAERIEVDCSVQQLETEGSRSGRSHQSSLGTNTEDSDDDAHSSVGYSAVSVSTISVSNDKDQDGFPRLNLIVDLPHGKQAFRARLDTGADINLISEEVASRIKRLDLLPESDLKEPVAGLSTCPVAPVKVLKLVFFIHGMPGPFKDRFYVVPDACVHDAFDALLGEGFIKATKILTLAKQLQESGE